MTIGGDSKILKCRLMNQNALAYFGLLWVLGARMAVRYGTLHFSANSTIRLYGT